ncbi:cytochrome P450 1B1 [Ceratobasidium sp. 370]|nr:cytochrome P450 1B1 [Ceratobasidium sp. 370]
MNWGKFVSFVGYTDLWKKYRRMMHSWFNKQAIPAFHSSQQHQARLLLRSLLDKANTLGTSEELNLEFYRTIAATLLQSVYGYELQRLDDPFVLGAKEAIDHIAKAASPSNFLVNVAPALARVPSWLPGTGWKTTLQEWGRQKDTIVEGTFNWTKANMAAGAHETSVVASLLENVSSWGQDEAAIQEVAIGIYAAMLLFPDVQAKAQQEIDTVIGTSRLPTIDDQAFLPYVGRLVQEVLRWQPVTPTAIPHVCAEDNEYRGYLFPRGAIVFGNLWAMTRDERVYKDPETFNPDRFLDSSVPAAPGFGWGRRSSLFITIASLLATFDITLRTDELGHKIVPTTKSAQNTVA